MRIVRVTAYVIRASSAYRPVSDTRRQPFLPGTDYFRMTPFPQLYPARTESVIVRLETDDGLIGWGECHAPIAAEVVATAVATVVGPVVLGRDPADVAVLFEEMQGTSAVRGHDVGYQADAIAGINIALWDIIGKALGKPCGVLLGGRFRETLPLYASGLRSRTVQERCDEARQHVESGYGVKVFLGNDWRTEAREVAQLRATVGDGAVLLADALWGYQPAEAFYLGQALQDEGFQFFEAPIAARDIKGHRRMASRLAIPVAIGELLRNRSEFLTWMSAEAAGVFQPDVMHLGISEAVAVAGIAHAMNAPIALHVGASTIVGMAATWQVASAIPNFLIQEHQPVMFSTFSRWLREPVSISDGSAHVPTGPGLGIEIDEHSMDADVAGWMSVDEGGQLVRHWPG